MDIALICIMFASVMCALILVACTVIMRGCMKMYTEYFKGVVEWLNPYIEQLNDSTLHSGNLLIDPVKIAALNHHWIILKKEAGK